MTLSEKSFLPGSPYLLAGCLAYMAYKRTGDLPDENDEDYLSERYYENNKDEQNTSFSFVEFVKKIRSKDERKENPSELSEIHREENDPSDEYAGLLSEIDEMEEDLVSNYSRETASKKSSR